MSLGERTASPEETRAKRLAHYKETLKRLAFEAGANGIEVTYEVKIAEHSTELVHFSVTPFHAICGVDVPNQRTSQISEKVTCPACRTWCGR